MSGKNPGFPTNIFRPVYVVPVKIQTLKNCYLLLLLQLIFVALFAQPSLDTSSRLIAQQDNIIKESTIIKIENLGPGINSDLPELRPTISADGNLLFFICENHPRNTKYRSVPNSQDIWVAFRDSMGNWSEARHLAYPLNTAHYNAVYWISPDNNRMLIRGAFSNGGYVGKGISMCHMQEDGRWSQPEGLNIKNYFKYDRGKLSGASMAPDGQTLLLYMTPEQGSALNDLFVSFLNADGTWTEPKNLGKKINGQDTDEMTPYLAGDGVTLYFSSNRAGGLGDNDIWKSRRLDNSWTKWSEPENLGAPINTDNWDAFFTMDAGGEFAYLTTSEDGYGASDIVRVRLMEEKKPDPVVLVTGNVYNKKTGEPLSASLLYETLPDGTQVGNALSSPFDGAFKIVLPFNRNYSIRATASHFFSMSENLNLDSMIQSGYTEIHKDLYLVPIEIGQTVRLNNVFFDFDKWNLRPESFVELDRVVKLLAENPAIEIELSAHTDSKGSDDYNYKLSDNRARSVMNYLIEKGINASRLRSQGYGETKPLASNDTDDGRQLNRRVEFTILKN